jgi:hypothetical protein
LCTFTISPRNSHVYGGHSSIFHLQNCFYSKKMLVHDEEAPMSGWHYCFLGGACDVIRWSNLSFHCVLRSSTVFSFLWGSAWQRIMSGLLTTIIFFLPSFLSVLFSLDFSIVVPMFFIAYFRPWSFYKKNLCFQFSLLFFPIRSLFFWFLIFFLGSLLKFCWFSILSFNQSLCCFIVFNLALIFLISFFFC